MTSLSIPAKLINSEVLVPAYAHEGDAGLDLCATKEITLKPFERALIPTGVQIAIPQGYAGFVLPRSGLAIKHGISLVNSPGLIDSNFRGEIQVIAINLDPECSFTVRQNDRVAQLVIMRVEDVCFEECDELDETKRGANGFGSSGISGAPA